MPHGRRDSSAAGDSRIAAVADCAGQTPTTRTTPHGSGAPSTSSGYGERPLLVRGDAMQAQDRQSQTPLVRAWQQCRETPTDSCVWEELFQRLSPVLGGIISRTMRRWGVRDTTEVDDLLQETGLKILELSRSSRCLPDDEAQLYGYFRTVAANTTLTWIRRRFADKRNVDETVPLVDHLESLLEQLRPGQDMELKVFIREVDRLLDCSSRNRNIFWLYYRQGLTATEIAAIAPIGLSVKGVESLIHRLAADLRERMR
jgi:RNA polymerase sigma-70 factor (ECF subfamily)